jgi:hypothetical protein
MFNILSHRGNTNQNNTKIPSEPSQNGRHHKNKQQRLVRTWGKMNPLFSAGEMQISADTMEISMKAPQETKNRTTTRTCCTTPGLISEGM